MNWKKIVSSTALTMLTAAAMPVSHAQGTFSATLSGFTYTLIDLDPNDGITPGLTLTNPDYWIAAAGYPDTTGSPNPVDIISTPGTAHVATGTGSATSSYNNLAVSAITTVRGQSPRFSADAIAQWSFALTPHTAAVIMGYGSLAETSTADTAMDGYAQLFATYDATYLDDSIYAYQGANQSKVLNVTFSSGDAELDGRLGLFVSAAGQSFAAAVPEPETYVMMIAGLAVVAYARRRKQA